MTMINLRLACAALCMTLCLPMGPTAPTYVKVQFSVTTAEMTTSAQLRLMVGSFAAAMGVDISDIALLRVNPMQDIPFESGPTWKKFGMTLEFATPLKQTAVSLVSQIKAETEQPSFLVSLWTPQVHIEKIHLDDIKIDDYGISKPDDTLIRGNFEIAIAEKSRWSLQKLLVGGLTLAFGVPQSHVHLDQIEARQALDRVNSNYKHFDVTFSCNATTLATAFKIVSDIEYIRMSGNSSHFKSMFMAAGLTVANIGFQIPELILPSHVLLKHQQGLKLSHGDTRLHPFVRQAQSLVRSTQFNRRTTSVVTDLTIVSECAP